MEDYSAVRCAVQMIVNPDGSLSWKCVNPHFGASTYTCAAGNAAKHLRAYHLGKLLRSAIFYADTKKKRKLNMNAAGKVADPTSTVDDGAKTLGFNGVPKRMFFRPEKKNTRQLSACVERWNRRRRSVANLSPQRRRTPPKHPRRMQENLEPPSWRHQRWLRRQDRLSEPSRAA